MAWDGMAWYRIEKQVFSFSKRLQGEVPGTGVDGIVLWVVVVLDPALSLLPIVVQERQIEKSSVVLTVAP